jgi:hypothetical protein
MIWVVVKLGWRDWRSSWIVCTVPFRDKSIGFQVQCATLAH